jgi:hypothetical protein
MFEFLGRGRAKAEKSAVDPGPSTLPQLGPNSATQREMVRFALHNVIKRLGIPTDWLGGEVLQAHLPGQGEALIVQLEVLQWNDSLVLNAPAFQRELLDELRRFDPEAERTRYLFTWKFAPDCNCPHTRLPEPGFWSTQTQAGTMPSDTGAPTPKTKVTFDLPLSDMDNDDEDHGFAPTQIQKY